MKHSQRGFTLIELLISLLVFSIMSIMAYSGLQAVLDAKTHTEQQVDRLIKLQTAFTFLGRDIEQAISRGVRDSFGDAAPALSGGGFGSSLLEFTRAGVTNPGGFARSSMQRVAYNVKENILSRWSWPSLDQGEVMEPLARELISGVEDAKLRFLDNKLEWHETWPMSTDPLDKDNLPRAVELTLDIEGVGEIKRLFRVAPGGEVTRKVTPLKGGRPATSTAGTGGL